MLVNGNFRKMVSWTPDPTCPCPGYRAQKVWWVEKEGERARGLQGEAPLKAFRPSCYKSREAERRRQQDAGRKPEVGGR